MSILDVLLRDNNPSPSYTIQVGAVVMPIDEPGLNKLTPFNKSLAGVFSTLRNVHYGFAIVASVDPFILVSEGGDMRWSYLDSSKFKAIGMANADAQAVAQTRLEA
jgi:hypothetical protein